MFDLIFASAVIISSAIYSVYLLIQEPSRVKIKTIKLDDHYFNDQTLDK